MAAFAVNDIRLSAMCAAVPRTSASNDDLEILTASQRTKFVKTVGISSRRIAGPGLCASDLCVAAAEQVMKSAQLAETDIGALVFVTQTPDYPLPGNSMLAQYRLGLPTSTCLLDLHQGCAGFVYGLATLACLMSTAGIRNRRHYHAPARRLRHEHRSDFFRRRLRDAAHQRRAGVADAFQSRQRLLPSCRY